MAYQPLWNLTKKKKKKNNTALALLPCVRGLVERLIRPPVRTQCCHAVRGRGLR